MAPIVCKNWFHIKNHGIKKPTHGLIGCWNFWRSYLDPGLLAQIKETTIQYPVHIYRTVPFSIGCGFLYKNTFFRKYVSYSLLVRGNIFLVNSQIWIRIRNNLLFAKYGPNISISICEITVLCKWQSVNLVPPSMYMHKS